MKRAKTPAPAAPSPPAEQNERGWLTLRAERDGHGLIEHEGDYRYIGVVDGLHAFAPAVDGQGAVYLQDDEIVEFTYRTREC